MTYWIAPLEYALKIEQDAVIPVEVELEPIEYEIELDIGLLEIELEIPPN